ncbi:hypothetical protein HAX54_010997 [Datura stramonium]|uniref:Bet v I/Major latex protein domain-containing protein n=1 Tax=Datura stramonium TaxID=4076 RepID=A0ABS8TJ04_DATST|nr:hypothetical protein [Datura stramonium]
MSLEGTLVLEINIKCDRNVFHEIYRYRSYHISNMSPDKIQNVDIHEGEGELHPWCLRHPHTQNLNSLFPQDSFCFRSITEPIDVVGHSTPLSSYFDDASDPYVRVPLAASPPSQSLDSARLVAQGFHRKYRTDYEETFIPMAKRTNVRTLLVVAVTQQWDISPFMDLNQALRSWFSKLKSVLLQGGYR